MPVVKIETEVHYMATGNRDRSNDALASLSNKTEEFDRKWEELPAKIRKALPGDIHQRIGREVRSYWETNYQTHYKWESSSFTPKYAREKDRMFRAGDFFKIAELGTFPMRYNSSVYGQRTGSLFDAISSTKGSDATIRWRVETTAEAQKRSTVDALITVRLLDAPFRGEYYRFPGGPGEGMVDKQTTRNLMHVFSWMQTGHSELSESVFIELSPSQLDSLRRMTNREWGVRTKNLLINAIEKVFR